VLQALRVEVDGLDQDFLVSGIIERRNAELAARR
jgi:hypothetical protein